MARDVTFQLDIQAAESILTDNAAALVAASGAAIASRAEAMAGSMSGAPPSITVQTAVGTIKRGRRAIATIKSEGKNPHANYVGYMALRKAKDAGRV